jgi:integrase
MNVELVPISYNNVNIFAAVDAVTGETIRPFTQFIIWVALGRSFRPTAKTRGALSTTLTIREYAYRLKRWFDFISEFNKVADKDAKISWQTAQKKHMDLLSEKLRSGPNSLDPGTRNDLRLVWELFYEEFCPFMGYSHLMKDLSQIVEEEVSHSWAAHDTFFGRISGRRHIRISLGKDPENEDKTVRVLSPDDIGLLLTNFEDVVFTCLSYLMYATGLRIGGALQVPYPDTDKNNLYITSPISIVRDYGIADNSFTFNYIKKGHERVNDFAKCDVPIYAWEDISKVYHEFQEERLQLWREGMIIETKNKAYKNLYPKSFWLNKKGKEVVNTDVWKAYRDTQTVIRDRYRRNFPYVTPHMLRHSYATRMVIEFSKKENIDLDPNNAAVIQFIHQYVQEQLGHTSRDTTIKYIRTALRVVKRRWIPKVPLSNVTSDPNSDARSQFDRTVDFHGLMKGLKKELEN